MRQQEITIKSLTQSWKSYVIRLLMTIPEDGMAELDGRERRRKGAHAWVLWALIFVLALASITNLSSRAYVHKAGFSAHVVGMGLALLVPVTVHFATKMRNWMRLPIWLFAIVFAFISASIQYQIYAPAGAFSWSKDHLEALAFGGGVPLAECLLAAIAAIVTMQYAQAEEQRKVEATVQAETERERQRQEQIEAERRAEEREERRLRLEAELEAERIKVEAAADAKRIKAQRSSTVSRLSHGTVSKSSQASDLQESGDRQKRILGHIAEHGDTGASDIAKQVGVGRSTVYRDLEEMERRGELIQVPSSQPRRETEYAIPQPELVHTNGSVKALG